MAMSNRGLSSSFFIFFLISCASDNESIKLYELSKGFSQEKISIKGYWQLYSMGLDTLNNWIDNRLNSVSYLKKGNWRLDSLVCVNKNVDKAVMCFYLQGHLQTSSMDDLHFFYVTKIDNHWYFFKGPVLYLPREYYQKDIHTPLSWEKLHELAMTEIFSGYLRRDAAGQWQINDHFFDDIIPKNEPVARGYGECFECNTEEEYVLYRVRKNWRERDTISQVLAQPPL